tara:strand:- start:1065 stop:1811 length:747 start_codon:yes stop_codon:yes gene_type:complete
MNTVVIVQARMGSTRLPGKVLLRVLDMPLLQFQIERLKDTPKVDSIVIATTTNPADDLIVDLCESLGYLVFRGAEHDVLDRYHTAAQFYEADCIVRINSDCPLIDPAIVSRVLDVFHSELGSYDYVSNILEKGYPIGLHTEVFSREALKNAFYHSTDPDEREHVTPYLYRNPDKFKLASVAPEIDMSHLRWTLDYPVDLMVIRRIIEGLYPKNPKFGIDEIVNFIEENPEISELNSYIQKEQTIMKSY